MKNKIFFDIDLTLIDTGITKKRIRRRLLEITKVRNEGFERIHKNYYKTLKTSKDFKPEDYCRYFAIHTGCNYDELLNVFYSEKETYKNIIYKDVLSALNKMEGTFVLGIFSEGFKKYQMTKLKYSGLLPFFKKENIYIKRRKLLKSSLGGLPKNATLVDDDQDVVKKLKKCGYRVVWVDRQKQGKLKGVKTITSLSEL